MIVTVAIQLVFEFSGPFTFNAMYCMIVTVAIQLVFEFSGPSNAIVFTAVSYFGNPDTHWVCFPRSRCTHIMTCIEVLACMILVSAPLCRELDI